MSEGFADSLAMLKSDEGQLNSVFACFGSAAQHCQHFELALVDFLRFYNRMTHSSITFQEVEALDEKLRNKTMGALLTGFRKIVKVDDENIETLMTLALEKRNFLMHQYYLEREDGLNVEARRFEMLAELIEIGDLLEKATNVTNGMRVAVAHALGLPDKSDAWSGPETQKGDGKTVFSIDIEIPE